LIVQDLGGTLRSIGPSITPHTSGWMSKQETLNDADGASPRPLSRLLAEAKSEYLTASFGVAALLVSSATNLAFPSILGRVIDLASSVKSSNRNALRRFLFGTLGVFTLGAAASWARVYCFAISGERLASHLRRKLHRALLFAKQEFFDTSHTGELTTLQEDIKVASSGVTTELSSGLRSLSTTATHTGMLLHLSPKLTVVAIAIIPVLGVGAMFYGRRKRKLAQELHRAIQKARVHAEECMANIKTVKTFGCEEKEAQRFERDTTQTVPYALRSCSADGLFMGGLSFATFSSLLLVIYFGGSLVKAGQLTVGKLTAFSMHASMVGLGASGLTSFGKNLMSTSAAAERLFALIDQVHLPPSEGPASLEPSTVSGQLCFEGVHFAYPSRPGAPVLRGLDLTVGAGQVVALIGPSGVGKSTIVSLLTRLYDLVRERENNPDQGRITLDGIALHPEGAHPGISVGWMRDRLGVVNQEASLFSGTIEENILYGCPEALLASWDEAQRAQEVAAAARIANAAEFIEDSERMPWGYKTQVGEHGMMLSGGQKQRIAIARAVIKRPTILLLDEATSALDSEGRQLVQDALARCMKGRTVLLIAHQLSTVQDADCVVMLDKGQVLAQGKHSELMHSTPEYVHLINQQLIF